MHSVSDLTTFARRTKGDVPPSLVGASTTVVGDKMYLFGGRLVSLRKMVADMYEFDLKTYIWTKIEPRADQEIPGPRYFHSADAWNDHLVIFGGMGYTEQSSDELCVLSDVRVFSLETLSWLPSIPVQTASAEESVDGTQVPPPRARYAHLSAITSARLFIIGGQNLSNDWLDDIHVYDLPTSTWVMWKPYPRHCGTYRSVAVCGGQRVRSPSEEQRLVAAAAAAGTVTGSGSPPPQGYQFLGPVGARFIPERGMGSSALRSSAANHSDTAPDGPTPTRELVHLPYSCEATDNFPNDVFLYSNYNFTDVRRELEVLTPQPNHDFDVEDRSTSMGGNALPPGLRFPTGAILGHHLVIAGTYLAHSYQSFSIWALDLVNMTWSRIDPGATLSTGSWSRGVLWENANRFLIFGNREGNLVEDYNRRLLSWDHVAYIDLEAFGIYQPPELSLSLAAQELGLAAFEEGAMADFELVCEDGRRISCSRRLLEDRWCWFRDRRREFVDAASEAMDAMPNGGKARGDVAMPELPGALAEADKEFGRPDPRLTPRAFHLSEPYPVTLAFLQWMYAQALITRLQHAPPVLSALLLLATTYKLELLEKQVRHAMHRALNAATSVGVYEVATLCDCQSLQIRALKVVMSSSRQRSSGRPRHQGGPSGGGGVSGPPDDPGARPRGLSDAPNTPQRNGQAPGGPGRNGFTSAPGQIGTLVAAGMNGYAPQHPHQLKLAITMPSTDGHAYDQDELAPPDPKFKFGVTTPYTSNGTGAAFFDTNETLPSAIDPHGSVRGRAPFQPRRKDSTVSGAGSDSGSSNTNLGRGPSQPATHPPQNARPRKQRERDQTLRPSTADSAFTDATDRPLIHSDDGGKPMMASPAVNGPPNVAEARMRRLLHELDSIGLTDEMSIGRSSHDIDDWAASSSVGHGTSPTPYPLAMQRNGPPTKYRPEDIQRLQQMAQARNWQLQQHQQNVPSPGPGMRALYGQNPQMNRGYPVDAPESASPSDDTAYYGSPVTPASSGMYPNQRMAPYSPQNAPRNMQAPQQMQQGVYHPMQQNRMVSSSAFPMPPRSMTPTLQQEQQQRQHQQQQMTSPASRAPRRPGPAGNDPPVSYYNTASGQGSNPVNRSRGSDNSLHERYLNSGPHHSPSMSGSQQSQVGLSPISPMSTAPAMTLSSSDSRTNSVGSGALETPVDGNGPSVANQAAQTSNLEPIKEKPSSADMVVIPLANNNVDRAQASSTPTRRRGSLDAGLMLKTTSSLDSGSTGEKGAKSPTIDLSNSPGPYQNPFLGGGLSGGLMFGGLTWAVKDGHKESGNPPPYRVHSPPSSSGNVNGRSNSLRAGSVGGRSDASGSSFGEGVHHSKSDHSSQKKASSPAVALATAFVKEGVASLSTGPQMTKAEKAAEKARLKAEKAAQKAEEARMKVEEEKDAKKNEAELKKKRKEEKIVKRLQMGEVGLYGTSGMVRFNA